MNRTAIKIQLVKHEGLRLKAYKCSAGKTTIGVGRNLDDVGISENEAQMLLDGDLTTAVKTCQHLFPGFDAIEEPRQHALVDMAFNLGETRLREFKKMKAAVDARNWSEAAAAAADSKWFHQVGAEPGQRGHTIVSMLKGAA